MDRGYPVIRSKLLLSFALSVVLAAPAQAAFDPKDSDDNLHALVKMRCSLDASEHVVSWWKGSIFVVLPSKAPQSIMGFEGFNICRMAKQDDGSWQFISRELSFYRDLKTGELIDTWENPLSGKTNEVLHVANDPVNSVFGAPGRPMLLPWESGTSTDDTLMMTFNVPLTYPNPLSPTDFPAESSGEMYVGSEHFMFFTSRKALEDDSLMQAPSHYGWTRIGPWLPWMKMGTAPGHLLYIAQGSKLDGIKDLPTDMQARIERDYPEYVRAPEAWSKPNETSWTYYRKKNPVGDHQSTEKNDR